MTGLAMLVTTTGSASSARALAHAALEAKLAACVQTCPIESYYVWQAQLREETEYIVQMKLRSEDYEELAALVRSRHDYDTPEILRIDISDADPAYLAWARDATRRS